MRIAVTGATGTIGRAAVARLIERGDSVVALSRDAGRARGQLGGEVEAAAWPDPTAAAAPAEALAGCDAVLHLLGEPLDQRWSDAAKRRIRDSRLFGTRNLARGIEGADPRPRVLVSQSASGYYGARGDEPVDEPEPPASGGFLADVVVEWEREARRAEELDLRVAIARTGVVLSKTGGALARMLPFFRLGIGGPVAGGRQYVPWIHLEDEVGALLALLHADEASGPYNLAAPEAATNRDLSRALGRVLRRPAVAPVPALALRALYGQMAQVVTDGVRLDVSRLEALGYEWRWPELEPALRDAVSRT
jgi:uncharacterized protein (TIGR01777 family)